MEDMCTSKERIKMLPVLLAASLILVLYIRSVDPNPVYLLLLIAVCTMAVLIHLHYGRSKNELAGILACTGKEKGHSIELDILRTAACVGVIATHSIQIDLNSNLIQDPTVSYLYSVLYVICLVCNPLYVMISGALLFPWKEEPAGAFYLKRAVKVLFPMLIYYMWYYWQFYNWYPWQVSRIPEFLRNFVTGNTPEAPHFWLLYAIISIYIVVPFMRYMFRSMPYRVLSVLAVVILLFLAVKTYLPYVYGELAVGTVFADWIGIAVLGYWVTLPESRKYDGLLLALSAAAVAAIFFAVAFSPDFVGLCCNQAPVMVFLAMGFFAAVFRIYHGKGRKSGFLLRLFGKYSYGIILIHWWTIHFLTRWKMGLTVDRFGYIGGLLISVLVSLGLSFVFTFSIDNTILTVVLFLWEKILAFFRLLCGRSGSGKTNASGT